MVRSGEATSSEQQQALQQRGLPDELLPSSMVTGARLHRPLSRQALEVLGVELVDHGWRKPSYGGR